MEKTKYNKWLIVVIIALISVLIYTNLKNENNIPSQIIKTLVKSDTTLIVDTLYYSQPFPIEIKVVDTMYIDKDSIQQEGDSILLPREEKVYTDDSTYNVRISGFQPILEEISVYPRTTYINTEKVREIEKKDRFTWGLQIGSGYGIFSKRLDVYVGIGCQINF